MNKSWGSGSLNQRLYTIEVQITLSRFQTYNNTSVFYEKMIEYGFTSLKVNEKEMMCF
jgi:hypothetical protein